MAQSGRPCAWPSLDDRSNSPEDLGSIARNRACCLVATGLAAKLYGAKQLIIGRLAPMSRAAIANPVKGLALDFHVVFNKTPAQFW